LYSYFTNGIVDNNVHDISQIKLYHVKYFTAFANLTVQLNTSSFRTCSQQTVSGKWRIPVLVSIATFLGGSPACIWERLC